MSNNNPWHLDKKITLSLIWSIVIVIAGGIFTTSWVMFELRLLRDRTDSNKNVIQRLIKVETELSSMKSSIERIERNTEKALNK